MRLILLWLLIKTVQARRKGTRHRHADRRTRAPRALEQSGL